MVEFQPWVEVEPDRTTIGKAIRVTYQLRTNRACPAEVRVRFFARDLGAFDPQLTYTRPAILPDPSPHYQEWSVIIRIPAQQAPGQWAYAPEFLPRGECDGEATIRPPEAQYVVLENGAAVQR